MTKTEIKHAAQREIMYAVQVCFNNLVEGNSLGDYHPEDVPAIYEEMDEQMKRIEKLFGYEIGSWNRGV